MNVGDFQNCSAHTYRTDNLEEGLMLVIGVQIV